MEARLLADEHFDVRVCNQLRALGHDVLTVRQACESKSGDGVEDHEVLQFALRERRVLLTDNRKDFRHLATETPWHEGIIACPVYLDFRQKATEIDKALRELNAPNPPGRFVGQWMTIPSEGADREGEPDRE